MLQLPAGLDAAAQPQLAGLLPALQAAEYPGVEQHHDGTGDVEGAHRGVDHIVVVLQLAVARVALRHLVDAKDNRRGNSQGQQPSGRQQQQLPLVYVFTVVIEWDRYSNEPVIARGDKNRRRVVWSFALFADKNGSENTLGEFEEEIATSSGVIFNCSALTFLLLSLPVNYLNTHNPGYPVKPLLRWFI